MAARTFGLAHLLKVRNMHLASRCWNAYQRPLGLCRLNRCWNRSTSNRGLNEVHLIG